MYNHKTLDADVLGYIDSHSNTWTGWCFHRGQGVLPLRVNCSDEILEVSVQERPDVRDSYNSGNILNSGWSVELPNSPECILEMYVDQMWTAIFIFNRIQFEDYAPPTFVVVDNFYRDPDYIRNFALKQDFQEDPKYHKGKRVIRPEFRFPGIKEKFEGILGCRIKNWDTYGVNGCFQYCIESDLTVYHCDSQQYAGVLFLTPDAPVEAGTRLYRSKITKKMKASSGEHAVVFKNGYYDSTQFDQVDVVGNVYNRLVLFDAQIIHAAPLYFGSELKNARLFQLFFFDLESV